MEMASDRGGSLAEGQREGPGLALPSWGSSAAAFWWLVRLRWIAVAGVGGVLAVAGLLEHLPRDAVGALVGAAGILLAYNAALQALGPSRTRWAGHFLAQIVVDCLVLATLVHFAGGVENPFLLLFVLHVVAANIVLSPRAAISVLGLATTLATIVIVGEGIGVLDHYCLRPQLAHGPSGYLDVHSVAILGGLVLTLTAAAFLTRSLTAELARSRSELLVAVDELRTQKSKLSATQNLIKSEHAKLQAIVDCMADVVIFFDPQGRVLLSNRQAQSLWPTVCRVRQGSPGQQPQPGSGPSALLAALRTEGACVDHLHFEWEERTYDASSAIVRTDQGDTLGVVVVARDTTERVAVESRLMHEERMNVVDKLAAAVVHEINNPLGVVSLYAQHALDNVPEDSAIRDHLQTILRNADSCRKITQELLTLARPKVPKRRLVELRRLCADVVASVTPLAERAGVRIEGPQSAEGDENERALWVLGDGDQLQQAVLNLALNGVEAVGPGEVVTIGAVAPQVFDGTYAIEVSDSGPGIPPQVQASMFGPFFTTKATGTGLGLSVAQNTVRAHNGRIEVDSDLDGGGTTFRMVLPATRVREGRMTDSAERNLQAVAARVIGDSTDG